MPAAAGIQGQLMGRLPRIPACAGMTAKGGGERKPRRFPAGGKSAMMRRDAMEAPLSLLDLDRLRTAPLVRDPFDFVIVEDFIRAERLPELLADFPAIRGHGSFPLAALR